jgi:hypothetical protein
LTIDLFFIIVIIILVLFLKQTIGEFFLYMII